MTTNNQTQENRLPKLMRCQTINGDQYGTITNIKIVDGEYHGKFGKIDVKWVEGSLWASFTDK